jgi:diguanylate cyclase (GGDEF)-like protein
VDGLTGAADVGELIAIERYLDRRSRAAGADLAYGLALVDITALRDINREHGPTIGDGVLVALADRLRSRFRDSCVARVGGDKFGVLVDHVVPDQMSQFARVIRRDVNRAPFLVDGRRVHVHVRVTFRSGPSEWDRTDLLWAVQREHQVDGQREMASRLHALEEMADLDGMLARDLDLRTRLALAEQRARQDPLTGAFNRNGYDELLPSLRAPYAIAFVDIDNLRELNKIDGENWAAGDHALKGVTRLLEQLDPGGVVVRWGGDEFLVILPGRTTVEALRLLEGLLTDPRKRLRAGDVPVTFSGGVDAVRFDGDHDRAMVAAQEKTRAAKSEGRSRFYA